MSSPCKFKPGDRVWAVDSYLVRPKVKRGVYVKQHPLGPIDEPVCVIDWEDEIAPSLWREKNLHHEKESGVRA